MIRFIYGDTLHKHPKLAHSMFQDRAEQFCNRLVWPVSVNHIGEERDEYDSMNPLYVIVVNEHGLHEASVRLLPTVGRTMVDDHFLNLTDGVRIKSPTIWECTRFCASPQADSTAAAKLFVAGAKAMTEFSVEHCVGVFDGKMLPVYRRIGCMPTVIGWSGSKSAGIGVGLWEFDNRKFNRLLHRCSILDVEMDLYLANSGFLAKDGSVISAYAA